MKISPFNSLILIFLLFLSCSSNNDNPKYEYTEESLKNTAWKGNLQDSDGKMTDVMIYFETKEYSFLWLKKDPDDVAFTNVYSISYSLDNKLLSIYSNSWDHDSFIINGQWWLTQSTELSISLVRDPETKNQSILQLTKIIK